MIQVAYFIFYKKHLRFLTILLLYVIADLKDTFPSDEDDDEMMNESEMLAMLEEAESRFHYYNRKKQVQIPRDF